MQINDRFAQFSEALYVADRHARDEVRQRALMQQKIAQKEKEAKEENLRMLAQRAREERAGVVVQPAAASMGGNIGGALAGYGSGSDSEDEESAAIARGAQGQRAPSTVASDDSEAEEADRDAGETEEERRAAKERDEMRRERRKEREREMRMSHMGTEQRAKVLAKCVPPSLRITTVLWRAVHACSQARSDT